MDIRVHLHTGMNFTHEDISYTEINEGVLVIWEATENHPKRVRKVAEYASGNWISWTREVEE